MSLYGGPRRHRHLQQSEKKSINPQSLTRLVQELCVEMDEPEFMGYGAGALKEVYRAMRRGMEK